MASPDNVPSCVYVDLNLLYFAGIKQGLASRVEDNKKSFEKLKTEDAGTNQIDSQGEC